jgi:hypothetical protein
MGHLEEQILAQYTGVKPALYRRFIDDCFGVATCPKDDLLNFINFVSHFHPAINFTFNISDQSLSFLDLQVSISSHSPSISTSVHYKPTDSHSYLLFSSSHPQSTKCSIPFSQFLRLRRICSSDSDFHTQAQLMLSFFLARGYPEELCRDALHRAGAIPRAQALTTTTTTHTTTSKTDDRPILVITFHPHNLPVKNILLKNFHLLQSDPQLRDIFPLPPLVAFKRAPNLKDLLISSQLRSTYQHPPGTHPCGKRGCVCCTHIANTTTFTGPTQQFTVRSSFTCLSTNLVYIIHCSLCNQLYVGETYRSLRERCSEHLSSITRPSVSTPVALHFRQPHHTPDHFRISAAWQNHRDGPFRLHMESRLIADLGTLQPRGINVRS